MKTRIMLFEDHLLGDMHPGADIVVRNFTLLDIHLGGWDFFQLLD